MSRREYPRIGGSTYRPKWVDQPKGAPKCCTVLAIQRLLDEQSREKDGENA